MATVNTTQIFAILQEKFGTETAENLTRFIEEKVKTEIDLSKETLATKSDVLAVKGDLLELKAELVEIISTSKADTIKWMFIFWIGQIAATFGFILLFLKS